jgi:hypothetical protein
LANQLSAVLKDIAANTSMNANATWFISLTSSGRVLMKGAGAARLMH